MGSLVGLLIGAALWWVSPLLLLLGLLASTYAGLWAIRGATGLPWRQALKAEADDPGWIVIDEIAGQMLAMMGLRHLSVGGLVAAFVLFRLFDIAKPGPIGWADRQGGAAGIMADDLLAGAATAIALVIVQALMAGGSL
jgi:phosphatidylglycerophosphatase A